MKRLKLLLVLLLSLTLTGCIPKHNLTDAQTDAAAEYMAGKLLQNDRDYNQGLIPKEELGEEYSSNETTSDTNNVIEEPSSDAINEGETSNDYTLSEVIGAEGFSVQYKEYKLVASYSEDPDSFSLDPADGYQLLVAKFTVKNKTKSEKEINLIQSGIAYQLNVNGNTAYDPILTLLENDLQYIDIKIAASKSDEVLLIFEVLKDIDLSNIYLTATKDSKSVTIEVK